MGNLERVAEVLDNMGLVKQYQGDHGAAEEFYEEALTIFRLAGDPQGTSMSLSNLARMAHYQGDGQRAENLCYQALHIAQDLGDKLSMIGVLNNLGSVLNERGDYKQAEAVFTESLELCEETDYKNGLPDCLEGFAAAMAHHRHERATQLFGAAEGLRERLGSIHIPPVKRAEQKRYIAKLQSGLSRKNFDAAWTRGRTMTLSKAIAIQLTKADIIADTPNESLISPRPDDKGLSKREVQVLRLAAAGMTDAQIADQLVVSRRTVHAHIHSIYSKLGVTNRGTAISYAIHNHLA